jgi:hypothetical protein
MIGRMVAFSNGTASHSSNRRVRRQSTPHAHAHAQSGGCEQTLGVGRISQPISSARAVKDLDLFETAFGQVVGTLLRRQALEHRGGTRIRDNDSSSG